MTLHSRTSHMSNEDVALKRPLRFGTRGSALALAQTHLAIDRLREVWPNMAAELLVVRTEGDIDRSSPLTAIGGRGVFTDAIERAILIGQVDAAVHSAKDLPTTLDPAAPIVAIPDRNDPRDVLVSRHGVPLELLPANPVIGTSSRRREVQIKRLRPDAYLVNLRGNIDTRLKRAESDAYDAIVLAAAGVLRMGWGERICQFFAVEEIVPSPGQGAIAVQARDDSEAARLLQALDDPRASGPVMLERVFLAAIGAGCSMPIGAYVREEDGRFALTAVMADATGQRIAFSDETLVQGDEISHVAEIAKKMLREVNDEFTPRVWSGALPGKADLSGASVVITRPRQQAGPLLEAFASRGAEAIALPTVRIASLDDTATVDTALAGAARGEFDWLAFTSVNAVETVADRLNALGIEAKDLASLRVAAVGPVTAAAAEAVGFGVALVPDIADAEHLGASLRSLLAPGARVLYPRSVQGRETLPQALRESGAEVFVIDAYQTVPEPVGDAAALERMRAGQVDAITFSSPSSVRGLMTMVGTDCGDVLSITAICAGAVTATAAREAGFTAVVVSDDPSAAALTNAWAAFWSEQSTARAGRGGFRAPTSMEINGTFA